MRPLIGITVVIGFIICLLIATLYLLRRLRFTPLRVVVAIFGGVLTDYLLRAAIFVGDLSAAHWVSFAEWGYRDLFGVRSAAVRVFYPDYYFPSPDSVLPEHPTVELVADLLPILLWAFVFGALYFLRVRRAPQTI